ncbi:MAG: hypothetical protein V3T77_04735 [Planctomycetota bacterium]
MVRGLLIPTVLGLLGLLLATLLLATMGMSEESLAEQNSKETVPLREALTTYLGALEKAAVFETTRGELGLQMTLFPDAWQYEVLKRLSQGLDRKQSADQIMASFARDKKELRRLQRKGGVRVVLVHPALVAREKNKKNRKAPEDDIVHLFSANLRKSLRFTFSGGKVDWKGWRDPKDLEVTTVQVAHFWTVKNRRRVPVISPLKPKGARAVFRNARASIWGLLPKGLPGRSKGVLKLQIADYDEFTGTYSDVHVIDLNEESNFLERNLNVELSASFPLFFPSIPEPLQEFLQNAKAHM